MVYFPTTEPGKDCTVTDPTTEPGKDCTVTYLTNRTVTNQTVTNHTVTNRTVTNNTVNYPTVTNNTVTNNTANYPTAELVQVGTPDKGGGSEVDKPIPDKDCAMKVDSRKVEVNRESILVTKMAPSVCCHGPK